MSDLDAPAEWVECELSNYGAIVTGNTPKKTFRLNHSGGYLFFKPTDLEAGRHTKNAAESVTEEGQAVARRLPRFSTLVTCIGATIGKTGFIGADGTCNQQINAIIPNDYVSPLFVYYYAVSPLCQFDIKENASSTTLPILNKTKFSRIRGLLPPLAEQKVIAAKLDELLAQVDSIKARLDAIPAILKRFRQSVLAAAVSGRLTEDWRGDDGGGSSLFDDSWQWHNIPSSWEIKKYSEVTDSRLGKMLDKTKNKGKPHKYLGNINVRWFEFDLGNVQEILINDSEASELSLRVGDIMICEGGEPGRCAVWANKGDETIVFQKALHRARVKKSVLFPEWLVYNLKNDADNLLLSQLFTGTTIKHLTGRSLSKYPIRIPPLEEQKIIINEVKKLNTILDSIEQRVQDALRQADNLTQSILAKAFGGELTAEWRKQNPDLISGENSAEALLERIRLERETAKPTKAKRKTRVA